MRLGETMYPRIRQEGLIYFITSNIVSRSRVFTSASFVIPILDSLNFYRFQHRCKLLGYVIMPDHLHLLRYPQGRADVISDFMRDFKLFTSGRISRQAGLEVEADWDALFQEFGARDGNAERQVWQESFWENMTLSKGTFRQKLNYIHMNPVRADLVDDPGDYPYSSYRNYQFGDETLITVDKDWLEP